MPNDLEEFLRRAAEIRQQRSLEQRAEAQRIAEQEQRSRPRQYTDSRSERHVDAIHVDYDDDEGDEPIIGIEILEDGGGKPSRSQADHRDSSSDTRYNSERSRSNTSSTANEIKAMMRRPDGMRQAFLIREILNRPRF
ncbi:hypothetical protein [Rhodopirellula sallentina]|uniref:Uncharacterized protein n=1 Tax=Rhodopirellula sallentina SM41 TaxID=1263870 RepID=M5U2J9_9BACT|nr:hypothetical protein [Rhodopirellula sallentina]EMI55504.1 hypothetical protein RSSM_03068 [Rhodopirellula sallentina SM41]